MGKFVNNIEEFFKFCSENEVKFVDFRFKRYVASCNLQY